jgi:hypothetical protein
MKELEQAGSSFEADAAKDDLKDLIGDLASSTIEDIAENLPGFGMIFKVGKTIQSIRDYQTMDKVLTFLNEMSSMSKDKRENLINKINTDPIYGQKFGAFILTAIDRHDFKEKSKILATACKFYERGDMNKDNFIRVKSIIEFNELSDLLKWKEKSAEYGQYSAIGSVPVVAKERFVLSGILQVQYNFDKIKQMTESRSVLSSKSSITSQVVRHEFTNLGRLMIKIMKDEKLDDFEVRTWSLNT